MDHAGQGSGPGGPSVRAGDDDVTRRRLAPPLLRPEIPLRPRVERLLAHRWDIGVVAVTAGAGFGKSTALAQAYARNLIEPRGAERWLSCEPADAIPSHLAAGIAAATGLQHARLRHDTEALVDALVEHLATTWPLGVSVVLDDVHHVQGAGADLLHDVITHAPRSVHFVLSSRSSIPGLARRRAQGQVLDIGEDDLRLTDDETRALAEQLRVDPDALADADGWPALAELIGTGDRLGGDVSLIVDRLAPRRRRSLAEVTAVGGGPPGLVRAAQSDPIPVDELVDGLPMITRHDDGSVVPHQLWTELLGSELDDAGRRACLTRVARHHLAEGDVERAALRAAEAADWATFCDVLEAACSRGYAGPALDVLSRWLELLPAELEDESVGLLLRGVAARAAEPFAATTVELLEQAMEGFRATDRVGGEVAAMSEFVYVTRLRGERDRLTPALLRLVELDQQGRPEVEGPMRLARALLAEVVGDDDAVLSELDAIAPGTLSTEWMAVVEYLRSQVLLDLGRVAEAVEAADRSVSHGGPGYLGGRYAAALMRWYQGDPTAALELPMADANPGATPVDRLYTGLYTAMVDAFAGRTDRAAHNLEVARAELTGATNRTTGTEFVLAEAAVRVADGDEGTAAELLRDRLAGAPLEDPQIRHAITRFVALAYVLLPERRAEIDALHLGPLQHRLRELAAAFVAQRDGDRPVPPDDATPLDVALPLRWATEFVLSFTDTDPGTARHLAAVLARRHGRRLRDLLRDRARDGASGARQLVRVTTVDGGASAEIRLLGPTALTVDGIDVHGGEWGRRALRAVLSYLALTQSASRSELVGAVFPDLTDDAADRNLRVVLTHLHRLLEPDRQRGDAPFLLRAPGDRLELAPPPHVSVDRDDFDAWIDRGDQARLGGASRAALDAYEAALALWRGPPIQDLGDDLGWVLVERDRLVARFVAASVHAAELHLGRGEADRAIARSVDALVVEPRAEAAHRVLVLAHRSRGDLTSARRALDACLESLAASNLTPAPETVMVERLVRGVVSPGG